MSELFSIESAAYWEGCAQGRLRVPRCRGCGRLLFYPRIACPRCHAREFAWETLAGRGTIYSFSTVQRAGPNSLNLTAPYTLVLVDLAEGVRIFSLLRGCDPADVRVGMTVQVAFETTEDGVGVPVFWPAEAAG